MTGLFVSAEGLAIIESDLETLPPELTTVPDLGSAQFNLVGLSAVAINGEASLLAVYEKVIPSPWERAVREVVDATANSNGGDPGT